MEEVWTMEYKWNSRPFRGLLDASASFPTVKSTQEPTGLSNFQL